MRNEWVLFMEDFLNIRLWKNESASLLEQWAPPAALPRWSLSLEEPIEGMVGHDGSGTFSITAKTQIFGLVPPLPDLSCHLASPATNMPVLRNSVASDSLGPHGLQPTRLLRPWGSPGKSTGVGCHCLLWLVLQMDQLTSSQTLWRGITVKIEYG